MHIAVMLIKREKSIKKSLDASKKREKYKEIKDGEADERQVKSIGCTIGAEKLEQVAMFHSWFPFSYPPRLNFLSFILIYLSFEIKRERKRAWLWFD